MKSLLAAFVGFVGFTGLAAAQAPVAVVEEVQGKVTGAEFMDYVAPGAVIKIGPAGMVVLGYMKSCWRETITGVGTVIVGAEESMVHLSKVKAGKVECNSSHSQLIDRAVSESAATVVRSVDGMRSMSPQLTLHGLSPVVETTGRGTLVVERLDVTGERYDVNLTAASVVRGKFYDFAKTRTNLKPGGTYAAESGLAEDCFLDRSSSRARSDPDHRPFGASEIVKRVRQPGHRHGQRHQTRCNRHHSGSFGVRHCFRPSAIQPHPWLVDRCSHGAALGSVRRAPRSRHHARRRDCDR